MNLRYTVEVTSSDYPELHVITVQNGRGYMVDEIVIVSPNMTWPITTIPVGCDAMLESVLDEFQALKIRRFLIEGGKLVPIINKDNLDDTQGC